MRFFFVFIFVAVFVVIYLGGQVFPPFLLSYTVTVPLFVIGLYDMMQTKSAIRRNFPLFGHVRFLMEKLRPGVFQYFIESETDGRPFSRERRSLIYQRAKAVRDTVPFGTKGNVYAEGYEWINHSMAPKHHHGDPPRVMIGEGTCSQPYAASLLNISAMSYGSLSANAVRALNSGARMGGFAHNTGEGGLSPYHADPGGDIIWQLGTGYFGARSADGGFNPEAFKKTATLPQVKMIEIKLSQGAKPGHGGILPAAKVTEEISKIRGVPMGEDVISPPYHKAFSTPIEMMEFITQLRELSGGKPVGIKLCVGKQQEFIALCKAMVKTGMHPDYIAVDGGEGGTGAAPLEFTLSVGTPLDEGLVFVHNCLVGFDLRSKVKLIAAGKVSTGFDMAARIAMGADLCYSARAFMMSLGCIQALECNSNSCPVGVATQNPELVRGLVVENKMERVRNYHERTVNSLMELVGAAGLDAPHELKPWHIQRRISHTEVRHYAQLFHYLEPGALLKSPLPEPYAQACLAATADGFAPTT